MDRDELCFTPASDLARMIREKRLSALEATDAVLGRIDDIEPHINAFITVCANEARLRAADSGVRDAAESANALWDDLSGVQRHDARPRFQVNDR